MLKNRKTKPFKVKKNKAEIKREKEREEGMQRLEKRKQKRQIA